MRIGHYRTPLKVLKISFILPIAQMNS